MLYAHSIVNQPKQIALANYWRVTVSKLLEDPKIAALVEKATLAGQKSAKSDAVAAVKDALTDNKDCEDPAIKKAVNAALKSVLEAIKQA